MSGSLTSPPPGFQTQYAPGLTATGYTDSSGTTVFGYAPPSQLPVGAAQYSNQIAGAPVGGQGQAASPGSGTGSSLSTWSGYIGELFKRIGVGALGLMLILLALFFMFAQAAIHEYSTK